MAQVKSGGEIYQALEAMSVLIGTETVSIGKGQTVRDGHPLYVGREELFEPFTVDFEYEPPLPRASAAGKKTDGE